MNWLREIINPIIKNTTIHSRMFVFDEVSETALYSATLTEIEQSPNLELIDIIENWDQVGILTKVVTYRKRG